MMAARALGLDCGPMSGFDNAKVDRELFSGSGGQDEFQQEYFSRQPYQAQLPLQVGLW